VNINEPTGIKKPVELDWVAINKSNSKEKEFDILEYRVLEKVSLSKYRAPFGRWLSWISTFLCPSSS
jgi:ferredoxin-fold anticodon binding domain-containing protein